LDLDPSFASGMLTLNCNIGTMITAYPLTFTAYQYPPGAPPGTPPIETQILSIGDLHNPIGPFSSLTLKSYSIPFSPMSGKDWILAHLASPVVETTDAASVFQVP